MWHMYTRVCARACSQLTGDSVSVMSNWCHEVPDNSQTPDRRRSAPDPPGGGAAGRFQEGSTQHLFTKPQLSRSASGPHPYRFCREGAPWPSFLESAGADGCGARALQQAVRGATAR